MQFRRIRVILALVPWLLTTFFTTAAPAAVINFSSTDLGAFSDGFVPFSTPNVVNFVAQGVAGNFVGQAGGTLIEIPHDPGDSIEARANNNAGTVVGRLMDFDASTGAITPHAFAWNTTTGTTLIGPAHSEAWNINEQGFIVGDFLTSDSTHRGALWVPNSSAFDFFEVRGLETTRARCVNSTGFVTGLTGSGAIHAFT